MSCPLDHDNKERLSPKNGGIACCYQLHDSLRVLYAMAHQSPDSALKQIAVIEAQLAYARQMIERDKSMASKG